MFAWLAWSAYCRSNGSPRSAFSSSSYLLRTCSASANLFSCRAISDCKLWCCRKSWFALRSISTRSLPRSSSYRFWRTWSVACSFFCNSWKFLRHRSVSFLYLTSLWCLLSSYSIFSATWASERSCNRLSRTCWFRVRIGSCSFFYIVIRQILSILLILVLNWVRYWVSFLWKPSLDFR